MTDYHSSKKSRTRETGNKNEKKTDEGARERERGRESDMNGDLEGLRDGPPKFEVGGRPMHPSPNISRSSVI